MHIHWQSLVQVYNYSSKLEYILQWSSSSMNKDTQNSCVIIIHINMRFFGLLVVGSYSASDSLRTRNLNHSSCVTPRHLG